MIRAWHCACVARDQTRMRSAQRPRLHRGRPVAPPAAPAPRNGRSEPVPRPEEALIGVMYDDEISRTYFDGFAQVVVAPEHWVFRGTGVRELDALSHVTGYEWDRASNAVYAPTGREILAHASAFNVHGQQIAADVTIYYPTAESFVFAAGSIYWSRALAMPLATSRTTSVLVASFTCTRPRLDSRPRRWLGLSVTCCTPPVIESVAAAARVAKTTVYRRYPSKRDLVIAALGREIPFPPPSRESPTRDALEAFIHTAIAMLIESGAARILAALIVEDQREPGILDLFRTRLLDPRRDQVLAMLRQGIERGELRPDIDPLVVTEMIAGAIFGHHVILGQPTTDAWVDALVEHVWAAIRA